LASWKWQSDARQPIDSENGTPALWMRSILVLLTRTPRVAYIDRPESSTVESVGPMNCPPSHEQDLNAHLLTFAALAVV
jgi:hypothetical protein